MVKIKVNSRPWTLTDVENRYETEGTMGSQCLPTFSQKDWAPLRMIGRVLRTIGTSSFKIYKHPTACVGEVLRIEDAARFVVAMRGRFKSRKACRDLERAERYIRRERRVTPKKVVHARMILDGVSR